IKVVGEDETPPQLARAQISGDNIYQLQLFDGGKIERVEMTVWPEKEPESKLNFELNDKGITGDEAAGDNIFSRKLNVPAFGLYKAEFRVIDNYGNETTVGIPESF